MAQPYVGEIRMFGGNFAPAGWMFCEGQEISISENETLFNLIGTIYGGDGEQLFALPDLRGRLPVHMGGNYVLGQKAGVEEVTLNVNQIPSHTHPMLVSADPVSTINAKDNLLGTPATATPFYAATPSLPLASTSVTPVGGSQPHTNFQPYLCISFIISLFGIYPSQS